jgi:ankyrin repeat protein
MKKRIVFLAAVLLTVAFIAAAGPFAAEAAMSAEEFIKLCKTGTPAEVQAAIDAGADVNAKDKEGWTVLMNAALFNEKAEVVSALVKAGSDVDARNNGGGTALMIAASGNENPEVVSALVKAGTDVNARDNDGWTALIIAARHDANIEVFSALLEAGADAGAKNKDGRTALDFARQKGNLEVVAILEKAGGK